MARSDAGFFFVAAAGPDRSRRTSARRRHDALRSSNECRIRATTPRHTGPQASMPQPRHIASPMPSRLRDAGLRACMAHTGNSTTSID